MPELFLSTARTKFLNLEKVLQEIKKCAQNLRDVDKNVERVVLFGSLITGNYTPHSDVDLLIVLAVDNRRMVDRIPEYMSRFMDIPLGVDVFPYTKEELERMECEGNTFILKILRDGQDI